MKMMMQNDKSQKSMEKLTSQNADSINVRNSDEKPESWGSDVFMCSVTPVWKLPCGRL